MPRRSDEPRAKVQEWRELAGSAKRQEFREQLLEIGDQFERPTEAQWLSQIRIRAGCPLCWTTQLTLSLRLLTASKRMADLYDASVACCASMTEQRLLFISSTGSCPPVAGRHEARVRLDTVRYEDEP